ncbi:hypothetical protein M0813_17613 [Anaeramoeba flamelloides]|uniref:Uncharacterized protein n=1 Tax=Anaeramoeba flamelloides TaxID=1746091 RepID=A0ABQ8YUY4_9EUKA|nr:hypothetical protein M0813_17613 [Anaeramoeba flamelloides]
MSKHTVEDVLQQRQIPFTALIGCPDFITKATLHFRPLVNYLTKDEFICNFFDFLFVDHKKVPKEELSQLLNTLDKFIDVKVSPIFQKIAESKSLLDRLFPQNFPKSQSFLIQIIYSKFLQTQLDLHWETFLVQSNLLQTLISPIFSSKQQTKKKQIKDPSIFDNMKLILSQIFKNDKNENENEKENDNGNVTFLFKTLATDFFPTILKSLEDFESPLFSFRLEIISEFITSIPVNNTEIIEIIVPIIENLNNILDHFEPKNLDLPNGNTIIMGLPTLYSTKILCHLVTLNNKKIFNELKDKKILQRLVGTERSMITYLLKKTNFLDDIKSLLLNYDPEQKPPGNLHHAAAIVNKLKKLQIKKPNNEWDKAKEISKELIKQIGEKEV